VRGDPLRDIRVVEDVVFVMTGGRVHTVPDDEASSPAETF
jgi:hypothetical protein